MPPANTPRNRKKRGNEFLINPGEIGRATGIQVRATGERDEDGLEPIDNFFSSASKATTAKTQRTMRKSGATNTSSESMDIPQSSGAEITETLNARSAKQQSAQRPPPQARSPTKTNIGGTPRRPSSIDPSMSARQSFTPSRPDSQGPGSVKRRLDFSMDDQLSAARTSPQRPTSLSRNSARKSGAHVFSMSPSPEKARRMSNVADDLMDGEDTVPMNNMFEDDELPMPQPYDDDNLEQELQPVAEMANSQLQQESSASKSSSARKPRKSNTRQSDVSQASLQDAAPEASMIEATDEPAALDAEEAPAPVKRKRGRPPKNAKTEEPVAKKARNSLDGKKRGRKPGALNGKDGNARPKANGAILDADGFKKPGSRQGLFRERHETPAEDNGISYTRSGRMTYPPLQPWKGEHAVFVPHDVEGVVLDSVSEIVRMDAVTPQKRSMHRSDKPRKKKRKRTVFEDQDDEDGDPQDGEEPWEEAEGVISGSVKMWDADTESALDERRQQELAFAASRIEARENGERSFRFAKTLTMPFFGSGIVELPPGGFKRTKNSRKMQMMFFVHYGKVTVEVAGTKFVITKGGVWQVPRGNFYSIENHTEREAKIFFSQGCEVSAMGRASSLSILQRE